MGSEGDTYTNALHGIVLEVPPGAVPCEQLVTLRIGCPCTGRRSVSPVVFLSTSSPVKLLKPARLTVPHFLDIAGTTAAEMGVVCLKAPREVTNGSVAFNKEEIEVCLSEQCGVVQLDHLATYVCLTRPDPSLWQTESWCVSTVSKTARPRRSSFLLPIPCLLAARLVTRQLVSK